MEKEGYQKNLGDLYDDEDTNETDLASKFFLWRWYRNTSRGLGHSRPLFMPVATMALASLAFFLGFPALERMVELLLELFHGLMAGFGREDVLMLHQRRIAAPFLAGLWAFAATAIVVAGSIPRHDQGDPMDGYVLPGSGIFARLWGIIGRRLYMLRRAVIFVGRYLRDINLQKIHLPIGLFLLFALALVGLAHALENILLELPARWAKEVSPQNWIPAAAWLSSTVVLLVLGWPIMGHSLLNAHKKSIDARERKAYSWWSLRLRGLTSFIFVTLPLAWMTMFLIAGRLD
ncbi:MAG: hypothetical protein JRF33_20700 [Deltaproteobacteria bacterium]|nr:hypothetical protein [Deltaproteobacteria bacterium]